MTPDESRNLWISRLGYPPPTAGDPFFCMHDGTFTVARIRRDDKQPEYIDLFKGDIHDTITARLRERGRRDPFGNVKNDVMAAYLREYALMASLPPSNTGAFPAAHLDGIFLGYYREARVPTILRIMEGFTRWNVRFFNDDQFDQGVKRYLQTKGIMEDGVTILSDCRVEIINLPYYRPTYYLARPVVFDYRVIDFSPPSPVVKVDRLELSLKPVGTRLNGRTYELYFDYAEDTLYHFVINKNGHSEKLTRDQGEVTVLSTDSPDKARHVDYEAMDTMLKMAMLTGKLWKEDSE